MYWPRVTAYSRDYTSCRKTRTVRQIAGGLALIITGGTGPWKPADAMESVEVLRIDDGEQFATVHLPFIERLI